MSHQMACHLLTFSKIDAKYLYESLIYSVDLSLHCALKDRRNVFSYGVFMIQMFIPSLSGSFKASLIAWLNIFFVSLSLVLLIYRRCKHKRSTKDTHKKQNHRFIIYFMSQTTTYANVFAKLRLLFGCGKAQLLSCAIAWQMALGGARQTLNET